MKESTAKDIVGILWLIAALLAHHEYPHTATVFAFAGLISLAHAFLLYWREP